MNRRLVSFILTFILVFSVFTFSYGQENNNIKAIFNDNELKLKEYIFINDNGKVMYPLRSIAEKLNYSLIWNGNDRITLSKDNTTIEIELGKSKILLNGKELELGEGILAKDRLTFVPLSFLSEALGLNIGWENERNIVRINEPKNPKEDYFKINNKDYEEIKKYMDLSHKYENFNGSILVARNGEVLLSKGYGFTDVGQNIKNQSQTRFAIGSITKQFTSVAIMQLEEKGLLKLEDKVSKYLPSFLHGDKITIHNLLTHSSGLFNYTSISELYTLNFKNPKMEDTFDLIKDKKLNFEPGTLFEYSNTGYVVLTKIIEQISGMNYEEYFVKNIFEPLNMKDTGFAYGKDWKHYHATPHQGYLELIPVDDSGLLTQAYGAGSIYSTVEDLYRWDRGLKDEEFIPKETIAKLFTPYIKLNKSIDYGYGWMIDENSNGKRIWHNGGTIGFSANMTRYVDEDLTIIILSNNRLCNVDLLRDNLENILFNKEYNLPVPPVKEIEVDKSIYKDYIGEYVIMPGLTVTITVKDERLYARLSNQDSFEIFPEAEDKYFYKAVEAKINFIRDEDGDIIRLILNQNGKDLNGIRIKKSK